MGAPAHGELTDLRPALTEELLRGVVLPGYKVETIDTSGTKEVIPAETYFEQYSWLTAFAEHVIRDLRPIIGSRPTRPFDIYRDLPKWVRARAIVMDDFFSALDGASTSVKPEYYSRQVGIVVEGSTDKNYSKSVTLTCATLVLQASIDSFVVSALCSFLPETQPFSDDMDTVDALKKSIVEADLANGYLGAMASGLTLATSTVASTALLLHPLLTGTRVRPDVITPTHQACLKTCAQSRKAINTIISNQASASISEMTEQSLNLSAEEATGGDVTALLQDLLDLIDKARQELAKPEDEDEETDG